MVDNIVFIFRNKYKRKTNYTFDETESLILYTSYQTKVGKQYLFRCLEYLRVAKFLIIGII